MDDGDEGYASVTVTNCYFGGTPVEIWVDGKKLDEVPAPFKGFNDDATATRRFSFPFKRGQKS